MPRKRTFDESKMAIENVAETNKHESTNNRRGGVQASRNANQQDQRRSAALPEVPAPHHLMQPPEVTSRMTTSSNISVAILGEIRLRDLKSVIPDSNLYHYFFKALDPEYGSIKEELSNDDDLLPGWEGKIVAWLEEEPGTAC
ncbi:Dixin [Bulinus truncatus]|nr:Dixin [Bulinus truncatus]